MHLVFLHAIPLDGRMWRGQTDAFPGSTSVPTLYHLGTSLQEWASGVLRTVDPATPLVVVGCSVGGPCALEMVRQDPERIVALVLIGTSARHRPEPRLRDSYIRTLEQHGPAGVWPEFLQRAFGPAASHDVLETAKSMAMEQRREDLIRATRVFHGRPDAADVVREWKEPLLVIGGDHDDFVPVAKATALAASAADGHLHLMRGCGHFPNLERPEEFNDVLRNWLLTVSG